MKVDVHAHCYPKPYLEELQRIGVREGGGIGFDIVGGWTSAEERIGIMDSLGVDIQVLSISAPNVYFPDAELSKSLAQMTNDFIADVCNEKPDRFMSLASLPLTDLKYASDELERAINVLGMDGVMLGTNVNQTPISDDRFLPIFEEINEKRIPVALHPMRAIGEDSMPDDYPKLGVTTNVGFIFETTGTIAHMTFKGTFEKCQNLRFILPHSGGTIPFLYPRWDMYTRSRPDSHPLRKLPHLPSHYLKKHYYDTALSYYHSSIRCTVDLAGVDHLIFGTDSPYTNDFRSQETIEKIETFGFTDEEKEKIYFRNAMNIFPKIEEKMQV